MKLLISIPAFNEEQSIQSTIQRCLDARRSIVENSPVTAVEITVVSDGSADHTAERAREFGTLINLIEFKKNRGYGAAIMEAWARSDAELLGFLDADGTCDPRFFANLCSTLIEKNADVALGSRLSVRSQMPRIRRIGNTLFAWLLSAFAAETVRDTASGMRVVKRSALRHLYPLPGGMHFTPAMSARAMLSDATRIVEIEMPYAEREGQSKLRVIRDGARFLRVIIESGLLYKGARILAWAAIGCLLTAAALMLTPVFVYAQTQTVAEWMIYRFLVSSLAGEIAVLFFGASILTARIASIAIHQEINQCRAPFSAWLKTRWFWWAVALIVFGGVMLVWPSAVQLWSTGHTDVHWSRFVVAMSCFGAAASFCIIWGIDGLLNLVEGRVEYLRTVD